MKMSSAIVFVVDDEAVIADTLTTILKQAGFSAIGFQSPSDVLEKARSVTPDLLITDVVMPEMSGIELAILVKSQYPNCKILLFSGQAATSGMLKSAREKGYDFEIL